MQKKLFYTLLVLVLVVGIGGLVFAQISTFTNTKGFHALQQVVTGDAGALVSVDANNDGVIDEAFKSTQVKCPDGVFREAGNCGFGSGDVQGAGVVEPPTCTGNNALQWSGSSWRCVPMTGGDSCQLLADASGTVTVSDSEIPEYCKEQFCVIRAEADHKTGSDVAVVSGHYIRKGTVGTFRSAGAEGVFYPDFNQGTLSSLGIKLRSSHTRFTWSVTTTTSGLTVVNGDPNTNFRVYACR